MRKQTAISTVENLNPRGEISSSSHPSNDVTPSRKDTSAASRSFSRKRAFQKSLLLLLLFLLPLIEPWAAKAD